MSKSSKGKGKSRNLSDRWARTRELANGMGMTVPEARQWLGRLETAGLVEREDLTGDDDRTYTLWRLRQTDAEVIAA